MGWYDVALFGQGALQGYRSVEEMRNERRRLALQQSQQALETRRVEAEIGQNDARLALDRQKIEEAIREHQERHAPVPHSLLSQIYGYGPLPEGVEGLTKEYAEPVLRAAIEQRQLDETRSYHTKDLAQQAAALAQAANQFNQTYGLSKQQFEAQEQGRMLTDISNILERNRLVQLQTHGLPSTLAEAGSVYGQGINSMDPKSYAVYNQNIEQARSGMSQASGAGLQESVPQLVRYGQQNPRAVSLIKEFMPVVPKESYQSIYGPYVSSGLVPTPQEMYGVVDWAPPTGRDLLGGGAGADSTRLPGVTVSGAPTDQTGIGASVTDYERNKEELRKRIRRQMQLLGGR